MVKYSLLILLSIYLFYSCKNGERDTIKIDWVNNLEGDYSFIEKWSYNENVFVNQFGQLVCDGFCEEKLDRMRDANGQIIEDSIHRYYQLFDTTHYYHTLELVNETENRLTYIHASKEKNDTIKCYTSYGVSNYSILKFDIIENKCIPIIELNSVNSAIGFQTSNIGNGWIKMDKSLFKQNILKAEFEFSDQKSENLWKGKVYTTINQN